ncbi:hypothetical protein PoB_001904000 [Plakobranchus ocellatus]|uniref:Uncharacterized protein n=1 Tax=Plakobranchus ocellatus TaxID=259542 RepID=A0AAV3ZBL0_9GAST|nr:hypothetical protein PoB_001904000 [Plakobranchus ocellatus]
MPSWLGMLNYYYAEGRSRRLLVYRSCSSPNQVPLRRPAINKQKARGTSLAVIKKKNCIRQEGTARLHIHTFAFSPYHPCPGNPRDVISLRLVFLCTVNGTPLLEVSLFFASP